MNATERQLVEHLQCKEHKAREVWERLKSNGAKQEAIDDWQNIVATLNDVIIDIRFGHYKKEQD